MPTESSCIKFKSCTSLKSLSLKFFLCLGLSLAFISQSTGQQTYYESSSVDIIIDRIQALESVRDPKCYATASRLEDFIYGTPLDEGARNLKISIQKEIGMYLREKGSIVAQMAGLDSVNYRIAVSLIDSMTVIGRMKNGDYFVGIDSVSRIIKLLDFQQYSSVAYSYRALLSVEQDILFAQSKVKIKPISDAAIGVMRRYLDIMTLASLQIADELARKEESHIITSPMYREAWTQLLRGSRNTGELFSYNYPSVNNVDHAQSQQITKRIISQKLAAYDEYNNLSQSVFLRNIQVYFARQMWPTDPDTSDQLRSYFLESLIEFTKQLMNSSQQVAASREEPIIRVEDIQQALKPYMPFAVNNWEDVIFFPNNVEGRITIESYDLDAFRDGGIHWRILDYAISDPNMQKMALDPHAAELVVEAVAQLGVLVLRMAGEASHEAGKGVLDIVDMESGFSRLQNLINTYASFPEAGTNMELSIKSSDAGTSSEGTFKDITLSSGVHFQHKSADWLSRYIRSYVFQSEENIARLSVPPAFGGSGIAAEDLNNDGWEDLIILGGLGNKVYLNRKDGRFMEAQEEFDINYWDDSIDSHGEPRQPIVADFDNDGFQDVFITYVNGHHQFFQNIDGERLENISNQVALDGTGKVAGPATALDFDRDGLLDLFIGYFGNYVKGELPTLSRHNQNGMPNKLYRNLGNFTFEEVTFTKDSLTDNGWTQACGHTDINQDGYQDIIVGNDFGVNRYYLYDPEQGFVEMSKQWKTDKPSYTMNVGIGDINNDQHPDLYISNIVVMQKEEKYISPNEETTMKFDPTKMAAMRTVEANDLFLSNTAGGQFKDYTLSDAVGRGVSSTGWSWDADFFDYDNDGDEDLYCLNGMNDFRVYSSENPAYYADTDKSKQIAYAESDREKNVFFVNENGTLENRAEELGVDLLSNSRSASYLDFDRDGDLDIVINNYHDAARLYENNLENAGNWLKIKLEGDPGEGVTRDAIGSSIVVDSEHHSGLWREVHSTTGYLSVHPKEQHIGLGKDKKATIRIKWANGKESGPLQVEANRAYLIKYPDQVILN